MSTKKTVSIICVDIWKIDGNYLNLLTNSQVVGSWVFDSDYERALVLNKASLDMICDPSVGEEQNAIFEKIYYAVRYILNEKKFIKDSSYMSPKIQSESFVLLY